MPWNRSDYPPNWEALVAQVRERSGNRCEFCGIANYTPKPTKRNPKARVVLTTAHLDHDKHNWNVSLDRLAHLCNACHLGYDHQRHIAKAARNRRGHYTEGVGYTNVGHLFPTEPA